jgi:hypothetical protein
VLGSSTEVDDESHNQKTNNSDNLDTSKYEFCFTVDSHRENIKANDKNDDNGDPCCDINVFCTFPELDNNSSSRDFSAERDRR